jgi:K(+)-stimulated pyrophosphate-energized sodium pump
VGAGVLAVVYGAISAIAINNLPAGNARMQEIAAAIQAGAQAYLNRQYSTIGVVGVALFVVLGFVLDWATAGGFAVGAILSGIAGYIGMNVSVRANVRTAEAANNGLNAALQVAFKGGAITGMLVVGLGLIGVALYYKLMIPVVGDEMALRSLVGLAFGGSLISIFARLGGGIFTKGADVGADLVGKVEAGIPEDDPRNPATIADNVGDTVGDCAGMAADLFESYEVTLVASIILGVAAFNSIGANPALGLIFPLAARAIGVIASIFGVFAVKARAGETDALKPINRGFLVAGSLTLVGTLVVSLVYVGNDFDNAGWKCFGAVAIGLVLAQLISRLTEYYTATHYSPVQEIAEAAETGKPDAAAVAAAKAGGGGAGPKAEPAAAAAGGGGGGAMDTS